jgi:hypothetical protein
MQIWADLEGHLTAQWNIIIIFFYKKKSEKKDHNFAKNYKSGIILRLKLVLGRFRQNCVRGIPILLDCVGRNRTRWESNPVQTSPKF